MKNGMRGQRVVHIKLSVNEAKALKAEKHKAGVGKLTTLEQNSLDCSGIPPRPYYTVQEVADRLLVSAQTVLRDIHGKKLAALQIRGCYRIGREALARYESECMTLPDGVVRE